MRLWTLLLLLPFATIAAAEDLIVQLPAGSKAASAVATASEVKSSARGGIDQQTVTFTNLLPGVDYDLAVTLADGTVLQGVNLRWYNPEPVDPKANPLTADDREAIAQLPLPDKDFFNKIEILKLHGDHARATALVKMTRDRAFHSDKGGEIIVRFDLWYYRFEAGGWMKIQQGQKQLRRDRFTSVQQMEKTIGPIRWLSTLGGVRLDKGERRTLTLTSLQDESPATQPAPAKQTTLGGAEREE